MWMCLKKKAERRHVLIYLIGISTLRLHGEALVLLRRSSVTGEFKNDGLRRAGTRSGREPRCRMANGRFMLRVTG